MSFTEQQLYDALGVGGKEPEVADPAKAAQAPTEEGAREPETAEPAEGGDRGAGTDGSESGTGGDYAGRTADRGAAPRNGGTAPPRGAEGRH